MVNLGTYSFLEIEVFFCTFQPLPVFSVLFSKIIFGAATG